MNDVLFALTDHDGWRTPDGDYQILANREGSASWRREGYEIHIEFQPPLQVTRNGLLSDFVRGNIRKARLSRNLMTIWIEDLPILGTIKRDYEL